LEGLGKCRDDYISLIDRFGMQPKHDYLNFFIL